MKTKYSISLSDLKQVPSGLVVSDHFVERWNERVQSSWERFCYFLDHLNVMCTDSDGRKHCLYYEPSLQIWYVFFIGKNKMLVSILTEDIYSRQINAARLSPNKDLYFKKAFNEQTLIEMTHCFQLKAYHINGFPTTYKCKWNVIFDGLHCLDKFSIINNFETFCETLVSSENFLNWMSATVSMKKIESVVLIICGKQQEIEVSI